MKVLGLIFTSVLFLFSIKGIDSEPMVQEKGAENLDFSHSVDSALVSLEADRISFKIGLEQSIKEVEKELRAVEALLTVYDGVHDGTNLKEKKEALLGKKENYYLALKKFTKGEFFEWEKRKTRLQKARGSS